MKPARTFILLLSIFSFFGAACTGGGGNTNESGQNRGALQANENANVSNDDTEGLELTIKLPFHPEEVVWREEPVTRESAEKNGAPAPGEKKLTAVIRFLPEDANKVAEQAEKHGPAANVSIHPEEWYPGELIAQSQMSGDETVKGYAYAANDFFQPPYEEGKLTRVEGTNYFILELYSK